MRGAISFQVSTRGVIINLNLEKSFQEIKNALIKHTREASQFFAGVDLYLNCDGQVFSSEQIKELIEILSRYEEVGKIFFLNEKEKQKEKTDGTILINKTIRSGQRLKYPSNIVIIGDINPGAEVIAGGDILVFGKLRGVVHAGATGSLEAQVIALKLQPTQLRIGKIISRPPEGIRLPEEIKPERAYIKEGVIVVEDFKL